jgi:hypothetical protein
MIHCTALDEHFPEIPPWTPGTGICLLCYTPVVLQDTLERGYLLHRYNRIVLAT